MTTLQGILVIALEQAVAAPLTTSRLADAGARVIKLERDEGDFARGYDGYVEGYSSYFVWLNRGKESCRVDLKASVDLEMVMAMVANADVFVQNLAPGASTRLGLDAKGLMCKHPRLIVCDISGYPQDSANADRKAYDLLVQAESGLSHVTGTETSGPSRVGVSICDIATGQAAYAAVLEALIRRGSTGRGCHIQLSLFDTMAEFMNVPYLAYRYGDVEPKVLGLSHPSIAPYGAFRLADGQIIISIQSDREWQRFCNTILLDPALAVDPRFERNILRVKNRAACDALVQAGLLQRRRKDVTQELDEAKIAYGFISTLRDLMNHPSASMQPISLQGFTGEILAAPVLIDGKRSAQTHVPALGEHDAQIRAEFAHAWEVPKG